MDYKEEDKIQYDEICQEVYDKICEFESKSFGSTVTSINFPYETMQKLRANPYTHREQTLKVHQQYFMGITYTVDVKATEITVRGGESER